MPKRSHPRAVLLYTGFMNETQARAEESTYQPPTFEVLCLDCEISAYAPDGDDTPLF